ncbi:MAG: alpha/beta hydrolase-fold protein [Pirellulales bacterium]
MTPYEMVMGSWSEISLAGHPCDVFEPSQVHPSGFVVIYLHGVHLTRLVDNAPFTSEFERHGLRVISPMTARSWWTDRICPEFDASQTAEAYVRKNVVGYIAERWNVRPPGIGLLGTSMGGQGGLRMAYKYPDTFPAVAALAPAIDYQRRFDGDETLPAMYADAESARQDTAILHVHPLNWPRYQFFACDPTDANWFESSDRLHMKLGSLGVPHTYDLETTGGGHGFDYYNRMAPRAVGFLVDSLEAMERAMTPQQ